MPKAIFKLTLDTFRENRVQEPVVVQHDYSSRFLEVTFTTCGVFEPIPGTAEVMINATRKDGESESFSGEVNADGTVLVPITQWMTELDDRVTYTVSAVTDKKLSTTPSTFLVKPAPNTTDMPADDTPEADLLAEVLANENARKASEATRVSNENARITAENARQSAESQRLTDEATRITNEAQRVSAESSRDATFKGWARDIASLPSFDSRISANSDRITNLEAGIPSSLWSVDETVAHVKDVPTNARPRAIINKIGGASYKTENLIEFPYYDTTKTVNGITFTLYEDGTVRANGTASAMAEFHIKYTSANYLTLEIGKTYTLSGCPTGGGSSTYSMKLEDSSFSQGTFDYGKGTTFTARYERYYIKISIYAGATVSNLVFKPMLNEGSVAELYSPHFTSLRSAKVTEVKSVGANLIPLTIPIPEAIQNLDGWGLGIPGTEYYNFLDWRPEDGVTDYHKMVLCKVFDGSENIQTMGIDNLEFCVSGFSIIVSANTINCYCNHYKPSTRNNVYETSRSNLLSASNAHIRWRDSEATTVDEMKAKLSAWYEAGDPLTVVYILATPEVTDISDLLPADNLIPVEGGGTITFENEYGYDMPNTVTYMLKEVTA